MKNLSLRKYKKPAKTLVNYGKHLNSGIPSTGTDPTNTTFTVITTSSHQSGIFGR